MQFGDTARRLNVFWRRFARDESGNVIIYVTILMVVFLGFVGLAIDFSRVYTTDTEAQSAADAAALAAASQLDGTAQSIARATSAANNAIISNDQTFSTGANIDKSIAITGIRFLTSLPASDADPIDASYETTNPALARFVEVTTESLTHTNMFIVAVGADQTATLTATAVAGFTQVICQITPLMMCNPNEKDDNVGGEFVIEDWQGKLVLAKDHKGGGAWAPGNWAFLDSPQFGNGAPGVAQAIASVNPPDACYGSAVTTEPGAKVSVTDAFNIRFDIYPSSGLLKNYRSNPNYHPAPNVTKGKLWQAGSGPELCGSLIDDPAGNAMGFPRDTSFNAGTGNADDPLLRFGNGEWDCATYWAANHSGTPPTDCQAAATNKMSRHDIYQYELDTEIPSTGPSTEIGAPICYSGGTLPASAKNRRTLYVAVINCLQHGVAGKVEDVPTLAYVKMFLTETAEEPSSSDGADVYLEMVDVVTPGADDGVLHDIVQLYR